MCLSIKKFFIKRNSHRYIYHHKNSFQIFGLCDKDFCKVENLDIANANIWLCDTKLRIINGTSSSLNHLNPNDYKNKNIYDVEPKDFSKFCGDLHKQAQIEKDSVKINLMLNNKLVYIVSKPILFLNEVIASVLIIIPYKEIEIEISEK